MVEILKVQLISSTQSLLRTRNIFEIFDINCPTLSEIRKKSCFQLDDGSFIVKNGLKNYLNYLLNLLKTKQQQMSMENNDDDNNNENTYQQMLYNLVKKYPLLKSLVTWYEHNDNKENNHFYKNLSTTLQVIYQDQNRLTGIMILCNDLPWLFMCWVVELHTNL